MNIILASKSPRRTQILTEMGIKHLIIPSQQEEIIDNQLTPEEIVKSLAYQKAASISVLYPADLVIGSDTIVVINNEILGKPKDKLDAIRMLKLLQNNTHKVITGVALIQNKKEDIFQDTAYVTFNEMTKEDILDYLDTKKPYDKAGSYGIQDMPKKHIKNISGDFSTIVGLPKIKLQKHLEKFLKTPK